MTQKTKLCIAIGIIIIAAAAAFYFMRSPQAPAGTVGELPAYGTDNPLEKKPDLNPAAKTNPFSNIKTNPFD